MPASVSPTAWTRSGDNILWGTPEPLPLGTSPWRVQTASGHLAQLLICSAFWHWSIKLHYAFFSESFVGRRSLKILMNGGTWLPRDNFWVHLLTLFICKMGTQTQMVYVLH
jgi:hypothetical protein